jgi:hypothetical protein
LPRFDGQGRWKQTPASVIDLKATRSSSPDSGACPITGVWFGLWGRMPWLRRPVARMGLCLP